MQRQSPLIYFYGLVPGQYAAVSPVYVVGDDPRRLCFTVAVDSHDLAIERIADGASLAAEGRRQYVTQLTQRRLHQEGFRLRSAACGTRSCSTRGIPERSRALQAAPRGLRPALPRMLLAEADGPMLRHGLQGEGGARIHAPRAAELRPAQAFLAERFEVFRKAG